METVIYFIRHAQSQPSVKLSHSEWPLSKLGRMQAESLSTLIQGLNIQKIISSPFLRCLDTIKPYVESSKIPFDIHNDLRERHVVDTVVDNFYEIWKKSWEDFHFSVPGCESSHQAQLRFSNAINEIVGNHRGLTLGISTHGNVLGLFLNFINSRFHLDEAEGIRNPDVLRVVARGDSFEWDQKFSMAGLDELATHHKATPIER